MHRLASSVALTAALLVISGCSTGGTPSDGPAGSTPSPRSSPTGTPAEEAAEDATEESSQEAGEAPVPEQEPVAPADFEPATAVRVVRHLAGVIGPREATGRAYARAADWVQGELEGLGYDVARQGFDVPAGESWGVPVPAGRSVNVVATPVGFDPSRPHLVVGAHLDTVPRAPGAEDNASGVGVLLAVAEAVAQRRTRLPVVLVAFGAEEPRGPGDDDHHYGSRRYAAEMGPRERTAMRAMVSLDRVGVGATVPVGSATASDPVQRALLAAARSAGVRAVAVAEQRSSDHWSFVRAGLPAARLGSTSYAAYHSAADVPAVVRPDQLARVGRVVLAWLAPR
jgi:aminopeptidase YwaD